MTLYHADRAKFVPVATNTRMPALGDSTQGDVADIEGVFRTKHRLACDLAAIQPVWQNIVQGKYTEAAPLIAFRAWLDIPRYLQLIPFTFNGQLETTADPGALITADPLYLRAIAASDSVFIRTYAKTAADDWFPISTSLTQTGEGRVLGSGALAAAEGTISETLSVFAWGPQMILGLPKVGSEPIVFGVAGDSIIESLDTDAAGFVQRALNSAPFQTGLPKGALVQCSIGGDTIESMYAWNSRSRWELLRHCRLVLDEYGINDLPIGLTAAQLEARMLLSGENALARGVRLIRTTITPSSGLSGPQDTVRTTVNDWIRGGAPIDPGTRAAVAIDTVGALVAGDDTHPFVGYFEAADVVETARNSGTQNADFYDVATHPNPAGHAALGTALAAMLAADYGIS